MGWKKVSQKTKQRADYNRPCGSPDGIKHRKGKIQFMFYKGYFTFSPENKMYVVGKWGSIGTRLFLWSHLKKMVASLDLGGNGRFSEKMFDSDFET